MGEEGEEANEVGSSHLVMSLSDSACSRTREDVSVGRQLTTNRETHREGC